MAATISESYISRPFSVGIKSNGRELIYDIIGTDDETQVYDLISGVAPAVYNGLVLDTIEGEPVWADSGNSGIWKGYARYVSPEIEYTFDTAGGTQKITQSYQTMSSYAPPGSYAPDFGGAIGVTDDSVEGVEVTVPKFDFSETHTFSAISDAFKINLYTLTGKKNGAAWRYYNAGEVLFLGCNGSNRGGLGQWILTYKFSASPNVSGLMLGPLGPITKRGWDYLWLRYDDFEDGTAYSVVKRPVAAYVEETYLDGDFSTLGI